MPSHFWFNSHEVLTPMRCCLPVYTGAYINHFVYTAGTSGSVKGQYGILYIDAPMLADQTQSVVWKTCQCTIARHGYSFEFKGSSR